MHQTDDAPVSLQQLRVLLVEDDPLICIDLETSLSDLGAVVAAATNLAKGLEILRTTKLDVAVLDFDLGAETSEPIARAAAERGVPFLYLSGYSERDARFLGWPGIDVLVKPISATAIAECIRELLNRRTG